MNGDNMASPAEFRFHANHREDIVLSDQQQREVTAERVGRLFGCGGIVMSRLPMEVNMKYEVQLKKRDPGSGWVLPVGVVLSSPENLTVADFAYEMQNAVVFYDNVVLDGRRQIPTFVGKALKNLQIDSRVGVGIDDERRLHLYINGEDQGVATPSPQPHPCYAMFDLCGPYRKARVYVPDKVGFQFRDFYLGEYIELTNNQRTAEKTQEWLFWSQSHVISHDIMEINRVYEVLLAEISGEADLTLSMGCVERMEDRAFVHHDAAEMFQEVKEALRNVSLHSRVGVSMDDSRLLHFHVNGLDLEVDTNNLGHRGSVYFALFRLRCPCKVTTLPVRCLT